MQNQIVNSLHTSPESGYLGIFEGRRKRAIAEAAALLQASQAQQERESTLMNTMMGLMNKQAGVLSAADLEASANKSNTTTYIVLAVALVVVVGLVMFFKFRKK